MLSSDYNRNRDCVILTVQAITSPWLRLHIPQLRVCHTYVLLYIPHVPLHSLLLHWCLCLEAPCVSFPLVCTGTRRRKFIINKEQLASKHGWQQCPHWHLFVWLLLGWLAFSSGKGPNDWKRKEAMCRGKVSASSNCSPHLIWMPPKQTTKDGGAKGG